MKYKIIDNITSDIKFEVYGNTLNELFENAALALFDIICRRELVEPIEKVKFSVAGSDSKDLLYNFLERLLALVDIEEMFFSKFNIKKINSKNLEAEIFGSVVSQELGKTVVKAVTNHEFNLTKRRGKYIASVVLDV